MSDVTRILSAIENGDPSAAEQLLPLVYEELRKLAAQRLAQERPGQTLQATALVHEAYLRLVDVDEAQHWNSRGHFFAAAAEAMRRILIEIARRKGGPAAGGRHVRVELSDVPAELLRSDLDLLALRVHPRLDELDGDQAFDRLGLLRHPDRAHAAFADLFDELVRADDGTGGFRRRLVDRGDAADWRWRLQEAGLLFVGAQQDVNALAQAGIGPAGLLEVFRSGVRRTDLPGDVEDRFFIEHFAGHDSPALPRRLWSVGQCENGRQRL